MKKIIYIVVIISFSILTFAVENHNFGVILDEDFKKSGVSQEKLTKAKKLMDETGIEYKKITLSQKQLELEVNKLLLEGAEQNLEKLESIFDKMGAFEAGLYKIKIRSQVEMLKYITKEQYLEARKVAIERLNKDKLK